MCVSVFVCLHMCTCGYACTVFKNSALSFLYCNTCSNITHTIAVIVHLHFTRMFLLPRVVLQSSCSFSMGNNCIHNIIL